MAWIESHEGLRSHPKTMKAARLLGISVPQVIGHLHCFWWWALSYAEKGCLGKFDNADIADGAMWQGDPDLFVNALLSARFVDFCDEKLMIHDWDEYIGRLMEIRERERARKSKWVRNSRGNTGGKPRSEGEATGNRRGIDAEATRNRRGSDAEATVNGRGGDAEVTRNSEVDLTEPNRTESEEPETSDEVSGANGAEIDDASSHGCNDNTPMPRANPEVTREDVPSAFRETFDLFLLRTGRDSITREELARIQALEKLHIPSRVQSEISKALERFGRLGRAPCELDWNYLWGALGNQRTGRAGQEGKLAGRSGSGGGRRNDPKWLKQLETWEKGG